MPPTPGHRSALPYNPALDGLRGVAILLVILSHAHAPLFGGAFYGVDLFFVLSGYLISTLLLQEAGDSGRIAYWRFYSRRLYRLMPALALFLLAYCLAAPLLWPDLSDIYSDALWSFFYLADYGIAFFDKPETLLHMWSLAVEEHFYLVWPPLLVLLLRAQPLGQRWRAIALLWLLAWAWRVLWVTQGQQFFEIFFRFDTRASGLLLGSLLAALLIEQPTWFAALRQRLAHGLWLVLAVPLLMAHAWDDMNVMLWGLTLVECATAVVLLALQSPRSPLHEMLRAPALVWIGKLSYGIYLWHYPIVRYLRTDWHWTATVLLGFALSALLAWISLMTVERWALRWRDRSRRPARIQAARAPAQLAGARTTKIIAAGACPAPV